MSIDRTYRCDLCRKMYEPSEHRGLYGIYWKQEATGELLVMRGVREVEHHLCRKCIEDVAALAPLMA
jgi:hypothetical protein